MREIIEVKGNCTLKKQGGRYVMTNDSSGACHSISARPDISPLKRLVAHWESFLKLQLDGIELKDLNASTLKEALREAKMVALDNGDGGDYCQTAGQLVLVDSDGERIGGGPSVYFDGQPKLRDIRELFEDHPKAVTVTVEGQTRWYGEGNAAQRFEDSEICDWWVLNIVR